MKSLVIVGASVAVLLVAVCWVVGDGGGTRLGSKAPQRNAAGPTFAVEPVVGLLAWQSTEVHTTSEAGTFVALTGGSNAVIATVKDGALFTTIPDSYRLVGVSAATPSAMCLDYRGFDRIGLPDCKLLARISCRLDLSTNWLLHGGAEVGWVAVGFRGKIQLLSRETYAPVRTASSLLTTIDAATVDHRRGLLILVGNSQDSAGDSTAGKSVAEVFRLATLAPVRSYSVPGPIRAGTLAAASGRFWIPMRDGRVAQFEALTGLKQCEDKLRANAHVRVAISSDGKSLVGLAQWDGGQLVKVYDVASGTMKKLVTLDPGLSTHAGGVAICGRSRSILLAGHQTTLIRY